MNIWKCLISWLIKTKISVKVWNMKLEYQQGK